MLMSLAALGGFVVLVACVPNPPLPGPTSIPTAPGPQVTLDSRLSVAARPIASGDAGDAQRGRELFQRTCVACHGEEGVGLTAPSLQTSSFVAGASDQELFDTIAKGRIVKGMPAWASSAGGLFSDDQILSLVSYVREINQ
jgi:cytochrome c oxidase cbb3-type subunit 3